jgi:hypothetical protein
MMNGQGKSMKNPNIKKNKKWVKMNGAIKVRYTKLLRKLIKKFKDSILMFLIEMTARHALMS